MLEAAGIRSQGSRIPDPVMRLDKFLQLSRLVKRRAVAHTLCAAGRVRVNGTAAKPSASVKLGDVITISQGDRRLVAKVVAVPDRLPRSTARVDVLARIDIDEFRASSSGLPPSDAQGRWMVGRSPHTAR